MYEYFRNNGFDKTLRVDPAVFDKVCFISDVHGEWEKFCKLKSVLNNFERCLLVCLGDIVDRGPDSPSLLKEFIYPEGYESIMLLGNHEYMLCDWIRNERPLNKPYFYNTGYQLRNTSEEELEAIAEWIESLPLTMSLEIAGKTYELGHASILDFDNPDPEDILWCARVRKLYFSGASILKMRGAIGITAHNPTRMIREWINAPIDKHTKNQILCIENRLFCIDCGCGKPERDYGSSMLGALIVDTKTGELSEIYIE